ncbi:MAG TPA: putative toxin-antitoxin system toxin component, PIN family [Stellaceae bacterium]
MIDTNVLVSGLLSPRGNEALILLAIHQGLVHPCFSEEILKEYAAVLARPKFAFPPDEIAAVLAVFRRQGELFDPAASTATSTDPDDTKFLQCAEAAQAEYIVTGNKRHFPEPAYGVTSIVSAGRAAGSDHVGNPINAMPAGAHSHNCTR